MGTTTQEGAWLQGSLQGRYKAWCPCPVSHIIPLPQGHDSAEPHHTQAAFLISFKAQSRHQRKHHPRIRRSWCYTGLKLSLSKQKWFNQSIFTLFKFLIRALQRPRFGSVPWVYLMEVLTFLPLLIYTLLATFQTALSCLVLFINEGFLLLLYQ